MCDSPRLFAAYRALHRLLVPRHPPCALLRLTSNSVGSLLLNTSLSDSAIYESRRTSRLDPHPCPSVVKERPSVRDSREWSAERHQRSFARPASRCSTRCSRKEVIQPQVPLRLPCYDFAPVIGLTFDGCLPCGLAHRLQVPPTSMA